MHDGVQYDPIQGQGNEPLKSEIRPFSNPIWSRTRTRSPIPVLTWLSVG